MAKRPVYHVEYGGHQYEIEADNDQQAEKIANHIAKRVAAGDPDLKGGSLPEHAVHVTGEFTSKPTVPDVSATGSFARKAVKGGTFNWGDEIGAVGNALGMAPIDNLFGHVSGDQHTFWNDPGGFSGAVRHNMGEYSNLDAADSQQHPTASAAGQIVGSLAGLKGAGLVGRAGGRLLINAAPKAAIPLAARLSAAALGAPVRTAAAQGAAVGAGAGVVAGAGEGDTLGSRAKSAAGGGIVGGAVGGSLGVITSAAAPTIARYWRIFRGQGTDQEATHQLVQALQRDGYDVASPSGVQALRTEISRFTGKPVSLADVGHATRARAGVALRNPSDAQNNSIDMVEARTAGQGPRIEHDIRQYISPRTDVHKLEADLAEQRTQQAKDLRDKALFTDAPVEAPTGRVPVVPTGVREAPDAGVRRAVGLNPQSFDTYGRVTGANDAGTSVPAPEVPSGLNVRSPSAEESLRMGVAARTTEVGTPHGNGRIVGFTQDSTVSPPTMRVHVKLENGARNSYTPEQLTEAKASAAIPPLASEGIGVSGVPAIGRISLTVDDPMLQQLARLPDAQKALHAALQRAESERALLATQGQSIDHLPDLNPGANLDVRTFDYLKRYLDDEANTLFKGADTATFKAGQAHQVSDLRNAIRDRLKEVVPEYGDYLDAYSASKGMSNALEMGRGSAPGVTPRVSGFDMHDPEQIAATQAGHTPAEQELYQAGVARNLLDKIRDTDRGYAANRIPTDPTSVDQLAATGVPPDRLHPFLESVKQERHLNKLDAELRGSSTQQRQAAQNDADTGASLHLPFNVASPWGWAGAGVRKITAPISAKRNEAVNETLLPMMLEQNPEAIDAIISKLEQQGQTGAALILRRQNIARKLSAMSGTQLGTNIALPEGDR